MQCDVYFHLMYITFSGLWQTWTFGVKISNVFVNLLLLKYCVFFSKYLFGQMKSTKKVFMLTDDDLFQITQYVEHLGVTAVLKA